MTLDQAATTEDTEIKSEVADKKAATTDSTEDTTENTEEKLDSPVTIKPQTSDSASPKDQEISISENPTDQPTTEPYKETPQNTQPTVTPSAPGDTAKDNTNAKWYVVHTYSGHESKVANTLKQRIESLKLADKILDILIPTQDKIEIKEGKKATIKEKIFPGYLLVKMAMDDNTWLAVRTTPGITGFIGTSTKPTALPEDEVKTIKRFMSMEAPKFKTTFSQGEAVKITDGPFSEFLGTVSEIDEQRGKLKVLVSVFGRETPVELDFLQVAKL